MSATKAWLEAPEVANQASLTISQVSVTPMETVMSVESEEDSVPMN